MLAKTIKAVTKNETDALNKKERKPWSYTAKTNTLKGAPSDNLKHIYSSDVG